MFYKLINAVKFNALIREKNFFVDNNKNNLKFIELLIKLNIIKYIKIKNRLIFIEINKNIIFKNIKNMYKPSKLVYIDQKNIKKITYKKGGIFILSTDKGLMTNLESINRNVGGVLLAYLII